MKKTGNNKLFDKLCSEVRKCALLAVKNQKNIVPGYKEDGSIVTETDLEISKRIVSFIKKYAPDCNIVSEEEKTSDFSEDAPYTFVLDPIDGTDAYSQGFDFWCVSLGILDKDLKPVGAVICAPHFGCASEGITVTSSPDRDEVLINGQPAPSFKHFEVPKQLTMGSNTLKMIDMSAFKGKVRSFGSGILHLLSPVLFPFIDACIDPRSYPWDLASSHAILLKKGYKVVYTTGEDVTYTPKMLKKKTLFKHHIFVAQDVRWLLENLPVLSNDR